MSTAGNNVEIQVCVRYLRPLEVVEVEVPEVAQALVFTVLASEDIQLIAERAGRVA